MNFPHFRLATMLIGILPAFPAFGQHEHAHHHHDHSMMVSPESVVMNHNPDTLPEDCESLSETYDITIYAGTEYAEPFNDRSFGFSEYQINVQPCSRVNVNFINNDEVRHQWMVHGLPRYLYTQGMFHLEAAGGHSAQGSFIVPGDDKTYLVHCDMAQHMEKGMKAQLVVGRGSGNLWAIPGISADFVSSIPKKWLSLELAGGVLLGLLAGLLIYRR